MKANTKKQKTAGTKTDQATYDKIDQRAKKLNTTKSQILLDMINEKIAEWEKEEADNQRFRESSWSNQPSEIPNKENVNILNDHSKPKKSTTQEAIESLKWGPPRMKDINFYTDIARVFLISAILLSKLK